MWACGGHICAPIIYLLQGRKQEKNKVLRGISQQKKIWKDIKGLSRKTRFLRIAAALVAQKLWFIGFLCCSVHCRVAAITATKITNVSYFNGFVDHSSGTCKFTHVRSFIRRRDGNSNITIYPCNVVINYCDCG